MLHGLEGFPVNVCISVYLLGSFFFSFVLLVNKINKNTIGQTEMQQKRDPA